MLYTIIGLSRGEHDAHLRVYLEKYMFFKVMLGDHLSCTLITLCLDISSANLNVLVDHENYFIKNPKSHKFLTILINESSIKKSHKIIIAKN